MTNRSLRYASLLLVVSLFVGCARGPVKPPVTDAPPLRHSPTTARQSRLPTTHAQALSQEYEKQLQARSAYEKQLHQELHQCRQLLELQKKKIDILEQRNAQLSKTLEQMTRELSETPIPVPTPPSP